MRRKRGEFRLRFLLAAEVGLLFFLVVVLLRDEDGFDGWADNWVDVGVEP